jgi:3-phenylpropionate/cinnamic acid dioxygenase small subunit
MNAPAGVTAIDCALLEQFILHEARLLDERRFRDWMALFTEDGTYWVPAVPDQRSPFDQASLFYDDRDLMRTRIERLEHPRIHVQTPPSRTAHLVGNVLVESVDETKDEYIISSTVIMVEYRDEQQRLFAGRQHHRLRRDGTGFRITQKRVDLINCDSAFEAMAVPI